MKHSTLLTIIKSIHEIMESYIDTSELPTDEFGIEAKDICQFTSTYPKATEQELSDYIRQVFWHYLEVKLSNTEINKIINGLKEDNQNADNLTFFENIISTHPELKIYKEGTGTDGDFVMYCLDKHDSKLCINFIAFQGQYFAYAMDISFGKYSVSEIYSDIKNDSLLKYITRQQSIFKNLQNFLNDKLEINYKKSFLFKNGYVMLDIDGKQEKVWF